MSCKLSIIHNLYKRNEFVNETIRLNLMALKSTNIDFQYILFNDNGDKDIWKDVKEFKDDVEYIYSEINYGHKMCSGGWVGAIPHLKGEYIHNVGQDDVMTYQFYQHSIDVLDNNPDVYLVFSNGFQADEQLNALGLMLNPNFILTQNQAYYNPIECFKFWFGINSVFYETGSDVVTCANNNIPAPGTIYRKKLHDLIGEPDVDTFRGACDFEYWARVLFNEYKCHLLEIPNWLYRRSEYSAGEEIIEGKHNLNHWNNIFLEKIKEKYKKLWEEKCKS